MGALKPAYQGLQIARSGIRSFLLGFLRGPFLEEENRALGRELEALRAHEETHRQLSEENTRLRGLSEFRAKVPWRMIPAEVIGRDLSLWSRTLLLDKGARDGVRMGQAIITPVGLVGRINEVGRSSSRGILITDPHFRVAAFTSVNRVSGLVLGTASGECLLTYLPLEVPVPSQESVLTSGGKSFCPDGIPVGAIRAVNEDSSHLYRTARIRPAVDLGSVEEVLVVDWGL